MAAKPKRIQLQRKKGWTMPGNTVSVARPHQFGNPFRTVGDFDEWLMNNEVGNDVVIAHLFPLTDETRLLLAMRRTQLLEALPTLRGKNLACFCALDRPCHADVLLKLANKAVQK